jgi:hypothetical protein
VLRFWLHEALGSDETERFDNDDEQHRRHQGPSLDGETEDLLQKTYDGVSKLPRDSMAGVSNNLPWEISHGEVNHR